MNVLQTGVIALLLSSFVACQQAPEIGSSQQALGLPVPVDSVEPAEPIGVLPGSWSTSSGQASYHVPIDVPPGRAGAEPSLSLRYADHGANGALGVGWSLGAAGSIRPCHKTFADDGEPSRPEFQADDAFCLDGQRLFEVPGEPSEYRVRPDRFWRIRAEGVAPESDDGVPERFVVENGEGQTRVYASRAVVPQMRYAGLHGETEVSLGMVVSSWHLSFTEDRFGNRVEYIYGRYQPGDAVFGPRLERIDYTANPAAGLEAKRSILFTYERRPDPVDRYAGGVHRRYDQRLARIEMHAPNPESIDLVWEYRLEYGVTASGRSRLEGITKCDQFGGCLPKTTFEWEQPMVDYERVETGVFNVPLRGPYSYRDTQKDPESRVADFNGDGFDDLLFWDSYFQVCDCGGTGCTYAVWHGSHTECDPDSDGMRVRGSWKIAYSDGTTLLPPVDAGLNAYFITHGENLNEGNIWAPAENILADGEASEDGMPSLLDIDGNGSVDIITARTGEIRTIDGVLGSIGSSFEDAGPNVGPDVRLFGDFNGDGLTDLVTHTNRGVEFGDLNWVRRLGLPDSTFGPPEAFAFDAAPLWSHATDGTDWRSTLQVGDLDGDGLDEVIHIFYDDGYRFSSLEWVGGVLQQTVLHIFARSEGGPGFNRDAAQGSMPRFMDINADGLADLVATNQGLDGKLWARINTGAGFAGWVEVNNDFIIPDDDAGLAPSPTGYHSPRTGRRPIQDDTIRTLDANADGRSDFLVREADSSNIYLYLSRPGGFDRMDAPFSIGEMTTGCTTSGTCDDDNEYDLGWTHHVLDVNGDGLPDIVHFEQDVGFVLHRHTGTANAERMVASVNGFGRRDEVRYGQLSNADVFTPATACDYPTRCAPKRGTVVRERVVDAGSAQERRYEYRYTGARYDATRGSLGFALETVLEVDTQIQTRTVIDQTYLGGVYPYLSYPSTQSWSLDPDEDWFRSSETSLKVVNGPGATYHVNVMATYSVYEEPEGYVDTINWMWGFDTFGQPRHSYTRTDGSRNGTSLPGQVVQTDTLYDNSEGHWRRGLVRRRTITSEPEGAPAETVTAKYEYGLRGELLLVIDAEATPLQLDTKFEYTDAGQVWRMTQSNSAWDALSPTREIVTEVGYDSEQIFANEVTNTLGHVSRQATHPAFGVPVASLDINGLKSRLVLDGFGRPLRETAPDGTVIEQKRSGRFSITSPADPIGMLTLTTTGAGAASAQRTNRNGVVISQGRLVEGAQWFTTFVTHDSRGRVSRQSLPLATDVNGAEPGGGAGVQWASQHFYDTRDRAIRTVQTNNLTILTSYELGLTIESEFGVNELGKNEALRTRRLYTDAMGQPIRLEEGPFGRSAEAITRYYHGAFGRLARVVDMGRVVERRFYDVHGRISRVESNETGTTTTHTDAFGNLIQSTFSDGEVVRFEHDDLGRVLTRTDREGTTTFDYDSPVDRIGWNDLIGPAHRAIASDGTTSRVRYDELGRVIRQETQLQGETFGMDYTFNALGQLESIGYPGDSGQSVSYSYDRGQITTVTDDLTGVDLWRLEDRDSAGRVSLIEYGNGLKGEWIFDEVSGMLAKQFVSDGTLDIAYRYAPGGIVSGHHDGIRNIDEHMEFDYLRRLTDWQQEMPSGEQINTSYTFDSVTGNMTQRSREVGGRIEERTDISYHRNSHRPEHRQVTSFGGLSADVWMSYERGRRVKGPWKEAVYTSFDLPRVIYSVGDETNFRYDAFGQRVLKTSGAGFELTTHGGAYRRTDAGEVLTVSGPGGPIAEIRIAGSRRDVHYLHQNYRGDTVAVSNDAGEVEERISYSPFGRRLGNDGRPTSAPMSSVHHGFTGHSHDDELGLINMRGRLFDVETSSFLTQDPIVSSAFFGPAWNGYAYVGSAPTQFTDPTGFEWSEWRTDPDDPRMQTRSDPDAAPNGNNGYDWRFTAETQLKYEPGSPVARMRAYTEWQPERAEILPEMGTAARAVLNGVGLALQLTGQSHEVEGDDAPSDLRLLVLMAEAAAEHNPYTPTSAAAPPTPGRVGRRLTPAARRLGARINLIRARPNQVVPYSPRNTPLENHHGVLDVWLARNLPGLYTSRGAATPTVALTQAQHAATKVVYREWLRARTGRPVGGRVDWTQVGPREMLRLAEDMFDAARVPPSTRTEFYRSLNRYLHP